MEAQLKQQDDVFSPQNKENTQKMNDEVSENVNNEMTPFQMEILEHIKNL